MPHRVEHLGDTVRRLRDEGRKRGKFGQYYFRMYPNHATFEHPEDAERVVNRKETESKPRPRRAKGRKR